MTEDDLDRIVIVPCDSVDGRDQVPRLRGRYVDCKRLHPESVEPEQRAKA